MTLRPIAAAPLVLVLAILGLPSPILAAEAPNGPQAAVSAEPVAAWDPWWRQLGDVQLAALIDQGLAADRDLACAILRLRRQQDQAAARARSLGAALRRIFAKPSQQRPTEPTTDAAARVAAQRSGLAARIALAYIALRRAQESAALRATMLDQYKDNAVIAAFRRDAGLVPAIDAALARSQDESVRAELAYSERSVGHLAADLAGLAGDDPDALAARLGPGKLAAFTSPPAFADDTQRTAQLAEALADAQRSARDARTAYREGAGTLATLYVAEAALLSIERAQIAERAERDEAIVRQWSARADEAAAAEVSRMARDLPKEGPAQHQAACD